MMKNLLLTLLAVFTLTTCGDKEEGGSKFIDLTEGASLNQTFDATAKNSDIRFTAKQAWTATIAEVATKADNTQVDWLKLSQYSGSAGDFTLTLTLIENNSGASRKAEIRIVCGNTTTTIFVEQKATETPENPNPSKKRYVKKINSVMPNFEQSLTFTYDNDMRIVSVLTEGVESSGSEDYPFSFNLKLTYEGNKVKGVFSESTSDNVDSTIKAFEITLDANGRATQAVNTSSYFYGSGEPSSPQALFAVHRASNAKTKAPVEIKVKMTQDYTYDANGHVTGITLRQEESPMTGTPQETRYYSATWDADNMIKVTWLREGNFSPYDMITYSNIENKSDCNLDLTAMFASTEWHSYFLDVTGIFDYLGKRSKHLPASASSTSNNNPDAPSMYGYNYTYTLDAQGYVTSCIITRQNDNKQKKLRTIEYVK